MNVITILAERNRWRAINQRPFIQCAENKGGGSNIAIYIKIPIFSVAVAVNINFPEYIPVT